MEAQVSRILSEAPILRTPSTPKVELLIRDMTDAALTRRIIPRISHTQQELFGRLWDIGLPVVVEGVFLGAGFLPEDLARFYGDHTVSVIDSRRRKQSKLMPFRQFLSMFNNAPEAYSLMIKVRVNH